MKKRFAGVAAICMVLSVASLLHAQDKRIKAKRLFDRGVLALESQDYRTALDSFMAAYETSPHWMVLAHIGACYAKLDDPVQAIYTLEQFLEDGGGDISLEERKSARKLLEEQNQKVGVLYLIVEPAGSEAKIDGKSIGFSPFDRVLLRKGQHRLEVVNNGSWVSETITIAAGQEVTLRLPDKRGQVAGAQPAVEPLPELQEAPPTNVDMFSDTDEAFRFDASETPQMDKQKTWGVSAPFYVALALTGAGLLTGGIGGGLYWHYAASERNFSDKLSEPQWADYSWKDTCHSGELHTVKDEAEQYFCETESTRRNYERLAGKAFVPLIAGGTVVLVAGVASLVFYFNSHWFVKKEEEPVVAITPVFMNNYNGLMFSGRF